MVRKKLRIIHRSFLSGFTQFGDSPRGYYLVFLNPLDLDCYKGTLNPMLLFSFKKGIFSSIISVHII